MGAYRRKGGSAYKRRVLHASQAPPLMYRDLGSDSLHGLTTQTLNPHLFADFFFPLQCDESVLIN